MRPLKDGFWELGFPVSFSSLSPPVFHVGLIRA